MNDQVNEAADSWLPVPLPTEIPPPPNLSSLPSHILHSGTVETLIGQNEDLMARLKVNIRRNSILEQNLMQQEKATQDLARSNNSLLAQIEVLQEKDRMFKDKTAVIEAKYDALYTMSEWGETKLQSAEGRLKQLASYQRRVRTWVRPFINLLKEKSNELTKVELELAARDVALIDVRNKLADAAEFVRNVEKINTQDQTKLVESYEARFTRLREELAKAKADSARTVDRANRFDSINKRFAELENKVIFLTRQNQELEATAAAFRKEAKELAAETIENRALIAKFLEERGLQQAETSRATDQYESLQAVWSDTQKKLDVARIQNESLSKLNQELGKLLKEERKVREAAPYSAASVTATLGGSASPNGKRLEKIDNLLAEIESGFSMAAPASSEVETMRRLDIIEDASRETSRPNQTDASSSSIL